MFLAAAAEATEKTSNFDNWDLFMIAYTVIIAIGFFRLLKQDQKNKFALGFTAVSLATFLFMDILMVGNWLGYMEDLQEMFKGVFNIQL